MAFNGEELLEGLDRLQKILDETTPLKCTLHNWIVREDKAMCTWCGKFVNSDSDLIKKERIMWKWPEE